MTAADQHIKQQEAVAAANNSSNNTGNAGGGGGGGGGNLKNANSTPKSTPQRVTINAPPYAYEELAVSSPSERNWRGIFIALLVIVAVLGLIVFSIVLVAPPEEGSRVNGRKPSLKDIFLKLPPPARFNGTWVSDTAFVYQDRYGGITLYNAENQTTEVLVTNVTFRQYNAVEFKISKDLKHVLFITDVIKQFEHSRLARYYIYDRVTGLNKPLSPNGTDDSGPHLQYATWSPNGSAIAFVHANDVYYKPHMWKDRVCRITNNGRTNAIYSGVPDWLYESEILRTDHAVWFSEDGSRLLYLSFNDTAVEDYKYPWYDSGNLYAKYPEIKSVKYPKVETHNPVASVWIANLKNVSDAHGYISAVEIKPTNSVETGSYITSARFYNENDVSVVWLNRRQNKSVILNCRARDNYNCTTFHVKKASCDLSVNKDDCGWTEPIFHPLFTRTGRQALIRCPVKDGNNGDFMHVCQLQSKQVIPLTRGAFEVTRILAWDEENHLIYAIATNEDQPGVRHLFKIGDMNSTQAWTCMTCLDLSMNITNLDGDLLNETLANDSMLLSYKCDYNNVVFSKNYRYYVQECLGPDIPVLFLVETATNFRIAILDASTSLRNKVKDLSKPRIKKFHVKIDDGDEMYNAQVMLHLPPVLREYEEVAFPLILIVDSTPGSQTVSEKWELSWPWFLASTRSYVVAHIDVRGSGYQGEKMRREIYKKIGSVEVQDQLAVLTYLRNEFRNFIDREKICVVGSGYGGYVAAMLLLQDLQQVINCSVSISPITNWFYYNSFFTEKYLSLPSEQFIQYQRADLTKLAGNLNERNYLLIHGSADIKVNPQHSMMFAKSMIEQGVLFQQVVYPDENHTFGKKSLIHLYKQIDQFFNESFGPPMDEWHDETSDFFMQTTQR